MKRQYHSFIFYSAISLTALLSVGCAPAESNQEFVGSWKISDKGGTIDPFQNWEHYLYLYSNHTGMYFGYDCKWKEVEKDLIVVAIPKLPKIGTWPEFKTKEGEPYFVFTYHEEDDKLIEERKFMDKLITYRRIKNPPRIPVSQSR